VKVKHDIPQGLVVNVKPRIDVGLIPGGLGGVSDCFGVGTVCVRLGDSGCHFIIGSGELVRDDFPLTLGKEVIHHHWPPGLPVHRTVQDRHKRHERGRHCFVSEVCRSAINAP